MYRMGEMVMDTGYRMVILKNTGRKARGAVPAMIRDKRFAIEVMEQDGNSLGALLKKPACLLVIDLSAAPEEGLNIIRALRLSNVKTEVIAYILPGDAGTLKKALRLGVVDCITHPFETERFLRAVERFFIRASIAHGQLTQDMIDASLQRSRVGETQLPKGLQKKTLNKIRKVFSESPHLPLSCDDVVDAVKLSRITVQRYLSYLSQNDELVQEVNYGTGGRPGSIYQYNSAVFA